MTFKTIILLVLFDIIEFKSGANIVEKQGYRFTCLMEKKLNISMLRDGNSMSKLGQE